MPPAGGACDAAAAAVATTRFCVVLSSAGAGEGARRACPPRRRRGARGGEAARGAAAGGGARGQAGAATYTTKARKGCTRQRRYGAAGGVQSDAPPAARLGLPPRPLFPPAPQHALARTRVQRDRATTHPCVRFQSVFARLQHVCSAPHLPRRVQVPIPSRCCARGRLRQRRQRRRRRGRRQASSAACAKHGGGAAAHHSAGSAASACHSHPAFPALRPAAAGATAARRAAWAALARAQLAQR
jgi:hypothetical protein